MNETNGEQIEGTLEQVQDGTVDVLERIERHLAAMVRVQLMAWEYQARIAAGDLTLKEINDWIGSMGLEDYRDHVLNQRIASSQEANR